MKITHRLSDGSTRVFNVPEGTSFENYVGNIVEVSKNGNWTCAKMDEETVCMNPEHIISISKSN